MLDREQIAELLKQSRAADKEDRENAELFEKMLQTPAWKAYQMMLSRKIQQFGDQMLAPAGGIDGCVALEFVKGALSGLVIARDLPSFTIAAAKELPKAEV